MEDSTHEATWWREWGEGGTHAARDRLMERYQPLARILAASLYAKRHCEEFEFGDYLQYANIGLMEALHQFNPAANVPFKVYATKRITGAVLDGVAQLSDRQQQINARGRLRAERTASFHARLNGSARGDSLFVQLADIAMGLALGYILDDCALYIDEERPQPVSQYDSVELRQLGERMIALVDQLPDRERLLIKSHYYNQISFEALATEWDVTRGRISQIHRRALERLREASLKIGRYDVAW